MHIPEVYLLAGLGFDKRIFYNLDLKNVNINYLHWIEPEPAETLDNYILRIKEEIKTTNSPIVLIGHSFGGIIVQRISKLIDCRMVIIISSIKSEVEIPISLKVLKRFPVHNYINKKMVLKSFPLWARIFGYNSEKGRTLFNLMINNSSDNYLRWSLDKIVNIKFVENISNLFHIHGTRDKTFPIKKIIDPIIIEDGSHFMVFSKGDEISLEINKLLDMIRE